MNRENKRKQFQNGYYKNHRCDDTFTCKHCGRVVVHIEAGTTTPLPCFLRNFPFTNSDNVVY